MSIYKSDPYYFVWSNGLLGPEAAIVMEPWIPKTPLFKLELAPSDTRSLDQLKIDHPAPVS